MRKIILVLLALTVAFTLCAAAVDTAGTAGYEPKRGWSLTDTLLDGVVDDGFLSHHDMAFQMRGSFRTEMPRGGETSARFRMDNFRWNLEGTFGRNREFYYHFRQSFNANFRSNTFDNLLESIDYAYMTWTPRQHFSLTFGKQVFALGGQEFWAAPVYVVQFSDIGGSLPCYQMGVMGTWHITPTQDLALQVSNIRGFWDDEFYHGGLPEGVESSRAPFLYTLNWNGSFLDDALEFRWSASYGTQAVNRDVWIFAMGQSYRREKWGVYLDLIYSRQGLDINGVLSSSAPTGPDGDYRTLEDVNYMSAIAYLHLFLSPSFSMYFKGSREYGGLYRPYGDVPAGTLRASWNGQACLEYMPTRSRDFRFFLHYNFYDARPTGGGHLLGVASRQEHRVTLGIIYIMNIF